VQPALSALLLPVQRTVSAYSCRDLSEQNLTGQLPDAITRLRLLSSMYARKESCHEPHAVPKCSPPQFRSRGVLAHGYLGYHRESSPAAEAA
jgi:hypothetical protein